MHNLKNSFNFLLCAVLYFFNSLPLSAKTLEYLYINASEGTASGGHVALRFDKETFHFQHYDGGIIRIVKSLNLDFDYQYRYLENRSFYLANIELTDASYSQLHEYFISQFFQQKQQDKLLKEVELNLLFFKQEFNHPLLSLQGAGLFKIESDTVQKKHNELNSNSKFLKLIYNRYGDDFLNKKIIELKKQREVTPVDLWSKSDFQLKGDSFSHVPYSFASRYLDISNKILFLNVIGQATELGEKNYFIPEGIDFKLTTAEVEHLKSFQNELLNSLTRLLNSNRPGWGKSAFVLYARILSLDLSIQSRRFVLLDSFQPSGVMADKAQVKKYTQLFQAQNAQALTYLKNKKKQLFTSKSIKEKDYSLFEMVSNYYYERYNGLKGFQPIRTSGEQRLPIKPVSLPKAMYPKLDYEKTKQRVAKLEAYKQEYKRQIAKLYQYNLFSRNCVTEIFSSIEKSGVDDNNLVALSNQMKSDFATFIPFMAFYSLKENNSVKKLPSFRQKNLARMYAEGNDTKVFFREFNTLTAKDYKFNEQDSLFLFFTDDKVWSRPLLGAGNLLTSAAYSLYGGLVLPFDSGKTLRKATMGIVMSLPELVFFNIRKGSYQYLLPLATANFKGDSEDE
ncbi:MAG: hypothetical protein GQ581_06480 [Methyloprofundus sp.]|nr:hypothetical protein [Methyloprofundus sp.]